MELKSTKYAFRHYLLEQSIVALLLAFTGCGSAALPVLHLQPSPADPQRPFQQPQSPPTVGRFTAYPADGADYAAYVRDYLHRQLDQIPDRSAATRTAKPEPSHITGKVNLLRTADPTDHSKTIVKAEVTFVLSDKETDALLHSIMFAQSAPTDADGPIQTALRKTVDSFIAWLYPEQIIITSRMARGNSKLDRQGRTAAAKGDYTAALALFRQAIDAQPDDHAAVYNAALVCEALGDYARAMRYYTWALHLAPSPEYQAGYDRVRDAFSRGR